MDGGQESRIQCFLGIFKHVIFEREKMVNFPKSPKSMGWVGGWGLLFRTIRDVIRKKRDYVGKIPKLGGGRSDPNPLVDVYLPRHAKMIRRC